MLGVGRGTGPLPSERDADVVEWDLPAVPDVAAALRAEEVLFRDPPPPFVDALARFDPQGDALVLPPPFAALYELAGRPAYGGRRAEWVALEDKTVTDALFAAAAVAAPPFEIVPAERRALVAAARRVDCGAGTVWAGDAQQGFNGSTALCALGRRCRRRRDRDRAAHALGARGSGSPRSSRGSRAVCTGSSPTTGSPCSGPSS